MTERFMRASMLMEQNRHALAAEELQGHLATEPNDPYAHSLLALCLAEAEDFKEATRHAEEAIRIAPDFAFAHYAAACVLIERNRFKEAITAINEAIRLDPEDADYLATLARIHLAESRHAAALEAAERGLQMDPQHVGCQNLRAMSLKNLGRHNDAAAALDSALSRDPENAVTHANKGWALLEKNQHEEALRHFREALRLNPELDWAREGIVVALKSRYRIYAIMLKYFLWMSKLSSQAQWGVILGIYFGSKMLGNLDRAHPEWAAWIKPVRYLLFGFAIMTWVADPLFNLALRFSPYGRLALKPDQAKAANLVGIVLGLALISVILSFTVYRNQDGMGLITLGIALLIIPVSTIYRCDGIRRKIAMAYCGGLVVLGATALNIVILYGGSKTSDRPELVALLGLCMILYFGGILVASFGANFLLSWRPKR